MKTRIAHLDKELIARAKESRLESDNDIVLLIHNYNCTDLLVASSRICDDGAEINKTVLINCGTRLDIPEISEAYYGYTKYDPFPFEFKQQYFLH
jgi:hypothetical protein